MTGSAPPRLAAALLHRFLHDNEPLAGDLLERFAARPSRLWFWCQVLLAILIHSFQQRDVEHPLGLAGHSSFVPAERWRNVEPRRINLTASPLPDVGGLGLVVLGVLVALVGPEILWIFLPAISGGLALGAALAIIRRRAALSSPATASRTLLRDSDRITGLIDDVRRFQ
jgi:hypothetical protein